MTFATQGAAGVQVDAAQWIRELRARDPSRYGERQASFAARERTNNARTAVIDAVTAALLLNDDSISSTSGQEVLSQFEHLFVNFDTANCCLVPGVRDLVPKLQGMFCRLSADNIEKLVEKLVALALQDRSTITWVTATIGRVLGNVRAVTNATCKQVLLALEQSVPPTRALIGKKKRGEVKLVEVNNNANAVCINRRVVCERGCGFSCARRSKLRRVPKRQKVTATRATRTIVPAAMIPHQRQRFLGASNQRYILRFCFRCRRPRPHAQER